MAEPTETEVKLRVASLEGPRDTLARLGARLTRERHLEDNTLFDEDTGSLAAAGAVLRLRRTAGKCTLTYKGPRRVESGIKVREERETAVAEAEETHAILTALGYRPIFRYQKYRETWSYRGQEVMLDEVSVGTFVEIEGDSSGIREVSAELGFEASDYMTDSYVDLFFAQGGRGDMVFDS